MDLNDQLAPVVSSLLDGLKVSLEGQLREQVSSEIVKRIASKEVDDMLTKLVNEELNKKIAAYNFAEVSQQQVQKIFDGLISNVKENLVGIARAQITSEINKQVANLDVNTLVNASVDHQLNGIIQNFNFPTKSIPVDSVDLTGLRLTGDQITGGIIEQFGSTGIEDRATGVQMTILDTATVFENTFIAPSASIKGKLIVEDDVVIEGDLIVNGTVPKDSLLFKDIVKSSTEQVKNGLDESLFQNYSKLVYDNLAEVGLEISKITQGGKEIVNGNKLGYHIVDTNIQRVGIITDLQTNGENLLCNTLYVTPKRVGINTLDPITALSIWDEECEISLGKRKQDVAYIAAPRNQQLVIGANNKDNLIIHPDGSVQASSLSIGNMHMTSSSGTPNYKGRRAEIVWNENPNIGGPIGWVCLGDTRWANFGEIS